jgi:hypothetical protein
MGAMSVVMDSRIGLHQKAKEPLAVCATYTTLPYCLADSDSDPGAKK